MALTWSVDAHSEVGLVRKTNQDSAYASPSMLIVADGMGGAAAGDLASTVAVQELRRTDETLAERLASATTGPEETAEPERDAVLAVLAGALQRANDTIAELVEDDGELEGMGTTVCGLVLHEDGLALVNIGDSRAYRHRDGHLERLTRDHSWVQTLVDDGRITEEEALEHPHRSLILRVLNGSPTHSPDLGWADVRAGDRLLVCSDGLCGLVTDARIADAVGGGASRADAVAALVELAHAAGGHDNITILLADVETDGAATPARVLGAAESTAIPSAEHTLTIPAPAGAQEGARAAVPTPVTVNALSEEERYALQPRRRPSAWLRMALGVLVPLLALAGGGVSWYQFTQTQYFIGVDDDKVALYRGVPDTVLGLPLSQVVITDATKLSDLPPYYAERVRATIPVGGLPAARTTLIELGDKAAACVAQRAARSRAPQTPPEQTPPEGTDLPAAPAASMMPAPTGSGTPAPGTGISTEDC